MDLQLIIYQLTLDIDVSSILVVLGASFYISKVHVRYSQLEAALRKWLYIIGECENHVRHLLSISMKAVPSQFLPFSAVGLERAAPVPYSIQINAGWGAYVSCSCGYR